MAGQATVTIGTNQWAVSVASTYAELTSGLSGVSSIPAQTGMLFDLGTDVSAITVDTSQMLFNMDVVFISSSLVVVGKCSDVAPGEYCAFQASVGPYAHYFLEMNAGEAIDVSVGDSVSISGLDEAEGFNLSEIIQPLITMMIVVMMMSMMGKVVGGKG